VAAGQAGPAPHAQLPAVVQLSAAAYRTRCTRRRLPRNARAIAKRQVAPSQQPDGHEVALQTHLPPSSAGPRRTPARCRRRRFPLPRNRRARGVAADHTRRRRCRSRERRRLQVAPEQQPSRATGGVATTAAGRRRRSDPAGQVLARAAAGAARSNRVAGDAGALRAATRWARRPVAHARCSRRSAGRARTPSRLPHRQAPVAEQLSDRASQATQVEPALPHADSDRAPQAVPAQQPLDTTCCRRCTGRSRSAGPRCRQHRCRRRKRRRPCSDPHGRRRRPCRLRLSRHTSASPGTLQTPPLQQPFAHERRVAKAGTALAALAALAGGATCAAAGSVDGTGVGAAGVARGTDGCADPARRDRPWITGRARAAPVGAVARVAVVAGALCAAAGGARLGR